MNRIIPSFRLALACAGVGTFLMLSAGCGEPSGRLDPGGAGVGPDGTRPRGGTDDLRNSPPYPDWTVESTPVARLGAGISGTDEHTFSNIRYVAAMSDGGLAVVDGGTSEVRWFDENGTLRQRAGAEGEGPGEFRLVNNGALLAEDNLVLFDSRNQRLTWFNREGTMVETRRLELGPILDVNLHEVENGQLMVVVESAQPNFGGSEFNSAQDSVFVVMVSDAAPPDTVHRLPGKEAATWVAYADGRPQATRQMELPFGQATLVGGLGNSVAVARSGDGELVFFALDGTEGHSAYRSDLNARPVSSELRQRYIESTVEGAVARGLSAEPARAGAQALLSLLPEGRSVPVYDRMLVDRVGERIWLRDFVPLWAAEEPQRWTIHDDQGRILAHLTTPARFEVMQISEDLIAGVVRDEMGVEYVAIYRFEQPSDGG